MVTLEAKNLTHLVHPNYVVTGADLDKTQGKFMYKMIKDNFHQHEPNWWVRGTTRTRTFAQFEKKHVSSTMTWLPHQFPQMQCLFFVDVKFRKCNWNKSQGEFVTHYKPQIIKFNKIAPDSTILDTQAVCMLQNVLSGIPTRPPVLNQHCQASKTSGQNLRISLDDYVSLLWEQAQVHNNTNTRTHSSSQCTAACYPWSCKRGDMEFGANVHEGDVQWWPGTQSCWHFGSKC